MFPRPILRIHLLTSSLAAFAALPPATSLAQWPERLSRLPESPNAVAVFNVTQLRVLKSKLEGGGGKPADKLVDAVGAEIAPGVQNIAICAEIDLDTLEPQWELSIAGASKFPSAEEIAALEGGYVDRIGEREVVWSPRQAYFIPLDAKRLAVVRPAARQRLQRWEQLAKENRVEGLTPYLKQAVGSASYDEPLLMALELDGAVSPVQARKKLAELESVAKAQADVAALAELFAGLKGIVFTVGSTQNSLVGYLRLDFGASAAPLQKVGKPLILEILANAGMYMDDMNLWTAKVQNNSLILSGPVTTVGLRQMLSFLTTPQVVGSMQETASFSTDAQGGRVSQEQAQLKATKFYFDSTSVAVHQVRNSNARNAGEQVTWNERAARKIDDLPMLNVDGEMLDYGRQVAELLRGASLTIRAANMKAGVVKAGAPATVTQITGAWSGPYRTVVSGVNVANPAIAIAKRDANRQGNVSHQQNMATIDELSLAIRRTMTGRYRIEF